MQFLKFDMMSELINYESLFPSERIEGWTIQSKQDTGLIRPIYVYAAKAYRAWSAEKVDW